MSNQVQFNAFNFKSSQVRVITDPNQEFWFCGSDVCYILGYKNAPDALAKHCKQGGIAKRYTPTQSGEQEMIFINEPNLYRLIIKSRKPEAEPFETWVFEEVLPQIRKTGKYEVQPQQLALPEPARYVDNLAQSEEALALFIKMYSFCFQAHEMQEKLRRTNIPGQIENEIGGHYLHNFKYPLEQTMAKAKKFIQSNTERLALVKAFNHLLN
ncbi:TPA: Bro-N domain-containing protein [Pasteurella multocida]|uniref:BRO-N domain-containing protein n=1 Tax=Pasteurella multocida TaxID=747 RepID=UPI00287A7792|nr:Bro-N domain-containing protein [Pasteurella multocida]WNY73912.1 Bro-N domain-containing protein [Pasteurella multocida]HDX1111688.1 Bro-N domain-containing protein [Pasteurella multocida]